MNPLIAEALAIARTIEKSAIPAEDGTINWMGLFYPPGTTTPEVRPMNYSLCNGSCGCALFLAAAASVADIPELGAIAAQAFARVTRTVQISPREMFQEGIGGGFGVSSVMYALVKASAFLQSEELLESAKQLAETIAVQDITEDRVFDLLGGSAGCLASLLALHETQPGDGRWLRKAAICAEHLLQNRITTPTGFRAWRTEAEAATGMGHGAAGISYALLRLYRHTADERLRDAAMEACEYENALYSEEQSNWASDTVGRYYVDRWCRGAPGIGLSRLGMLRITPAESFYLDIYRALKRLEASSAAAADTPCCGNAGYLELLMVADQMLHLENVRQHAEKLAGFVIQRARESGAYAVGSKDDVYSLSFHQGIAGIGYQLLRLANPGSLPSVLLWE